MRLRRRPPWEKRYCGGVPSGRDGRSPGASLRSWCPRSLAAAAPPRRMARGELRRPVVVVDGAPRGRDDAGAANRGWVLVAHHRATRARPQERQATRATTPTSRATPSPTPTATSTTPTARTSTPRTLEATSPDVSRAVRRAGSLRRRTRPPGGRRAGRPPRIGTTEPLLMPERLRCAWCPPHRQPAMARRGTPLNLLSQQRGISLALPRRHRTRRS